MQKSQQTLLASEGLESQAGDVLLLPIAVLAFWTLAYDFVLVVRWPAATITWFFLVIVVSGFLLLRRLWKQTNAIPGKYYRFHVSHVLLLVRFEIGVGSVGGGDGVFPWHSISACRRPVAVRGFGRSEISAFGGPALDLNHRRRPVRVCNRCRLFLARQADSLDFAATDRA